MTQSPPESALPKGFRFAATACGLKKTGALDLALISSDVPASAAAVFTQNLVVAAPVTLSKKNLRESKGRMRAVVVNAGNANCATGASGDTVALRTNEEAARRMALVPQELFVCSTGVIGVQLPIEKILRALPSLSRNRRPSQRTLRDVTSRTFNSISVDGDTSTNDTLLVLANGAAGTPSISNGSKAHRQFAASLEEVCGSLAQQIVADGEGAQRVIEIEVRGARTASAARKIAETIATSPLVKTAFAGADPNWGRIFAAAGRSGVKFDPSLVEITMAGIKVLRKGQPLDFNERAASNRLLAEHVPIVVDLHAGKSRARYWTCDFTAEYVRVNASYRT